MVKENATSSYIPSGDDTDLQEHSIMFISQGTVKSKQFHH